MARLNPAGNKDVVQPVDRTPTLKLRRQRDEPKLTLLLCIRNVEARRSLQLVSGKQTG